MVMVTALFWIVGSLILLGILLIFVRLAAGYLYRIPKQGQALVRTSPWGIAVSTTGMVVYPVVHRLEIMDVGVKYVEIARSGSTGLICKDNLRADIKVNFFIRVDAADRDKIRHVAQTLGCERASDATALRELFEPKFSDALKAAARAFNFEDLLDKRTDFREEIKRQIGTDLNGYLLDDAAIDVVEQTKIDVMDPKNILDSEGIKLITERTAAQNILANEFRRNEERDINKKNVETREVILQQNRDLAEAEEKQKREVASIMARENAETIKVQQEERKRAEKARIATEEEIAITEQNRDRQVIVAQRNKERTDAVEHVRVQKDRELEDVERMRLVTIAEIERQKIVEAEQKTLQTFIRDRVIVQKDVVTEEQRVKDTEAFATAEREKKVIMTLAEAEAEQELIKEIKAAEAAKKAAELKAEQDLFVEVKAAQAGKDASALLAEKTVIHAEGEQNASIKIAEGKKALAAGITAETAAVGMAEAQVIEAKATADAEGISKKAAAMKLFHEAGREHEEFKLRLNVDKEITLADIAVKKDVAVAAAGVVGDALKSARIDIVGGETAFFEQIVKSITLGKSVDRAVEYGETLGRASRTLLAGDGDHFRDQLKKWVSQFGLSSEDVKNLSVAAALGKMAGLAKGEEIKGAITSLLETAEKSGVGIEKVGRVIG